jgi:hypothetical protein
VQVQKFGSRKLVVIVPQMLNAVGFIPFPKSRIASTLTASILTTASIYALVLVLELSSVNMHFDSSIHVEERGHEKRASIQRTAFGRGEHAYIIPAPVALLIHVCDEAHKIPLPQFTISGLGNIVGMVVGKVFTRVQSATSAHAKNVIGFILLRL